MCRLCNLCNARLFFPPRLLYSVKVLDLGVLAGVGLRLSLLLLLGDGGLEVDLDLLAELGVDLLEGQAHGLKVTLAEYQEWIWESRRTSGKVNQMAVVLMVVTATKIM